MDSLLKERAFMHTKTIFKDYKNNFASLAVTLWTLSPRRRTLFVLCIWIDDIVWLCFVKLHPIDKRRFYEYLQFDF